MDNTNKNPIFSIKNFRSFGEDGADFELAPITVLTGCNSAGKSSLVKALMLLSEMSQQPDRLYVPSLNLYKREYGLGSYDKIIHGKDVNRRIEFSYKVWSNILQDYTVVRRTFGKHRNDVLNDGNLTNLIIEKSNGEIIFDISAYQTGINEDEIAESLRKELNNFTIASEYYKCLYDDIISFRKSKIISGEKKQEYIANKKKIENITKIVKENNVNPEDYHIEDLRSWAYYIRKRESEKEDYIKLLSDSDEEALKEFLNYNYPKNEPLMEFQGRVTDEVSSPWFLKNSLYIDSSSAHIRRIYSVEDNNKMGSALRTYIGRIRNDNMFEEINAGDAYYYWTGSFLNKWIKRFDVGDSVKIVGDGEGGIKIYLIKSGKDRLLADEGYGITQLVSLLLNIDISIANNRREEGNSVGINNSWEDLKSGYSNVKGLYREPYPHRIICVEEPENHLHPKYQSLLADMFVEAYQKYNIHFIIETHSEYLIRKLQVMVADKDIALTSNDVSLNYVEKNEEGVSHNRQIKIKDDGRLDGSFGEGFYDEAGSLSRKLFMLNN